MLLIPEEERANTKYRQLNRKDRVTLENLAVAQQIKKFPAFQRT